MWNLPISQYPEVVPPSVVVRATYPGANPKVIAETVAAPLEQEINGVENMLYMSSQSTTDGLMTLTVTFKVGTDIDTAQVQVQNRVSQALPRLPEDVRRFGVTTIKSSPDLLMVVHLYSPDNRYDMVYLRNYAVLQVRDQLARLPGVGEVRVFGAGDYSMRVWLDPQKVASRDLTAGDVVRAIREQNVQVAAGVIGAQPAPPGVEYQLSVNATGRLVTEEEFGNIIVKSAPDGAVTRLRDVARIELGAGQYSLRSLLNNKPAVAMPVALRARLQRARPLRCRARNHEGDQQDLPRRRRLSDRLRPHHLRARVDHRGHRDPAGSGRAGGDRRGAVPADLARFDHPAAGGADLDRRHVRPDARVRIFDQQRSRSSGWCSPSASWWTMRSSWWRTSSAISSRA